MAILTFIVNSVVGFGKSSWMNHVPWGLLYGAPVSKASQRTIQIPTFLVALFVSHCASLTDVQLFVCISRPTNTTKSIEDVAALHAAYFLGFGCTKLLMYMTL